MTFEESNRDGIVRRVLVLTAIAFCMIVLPAAESLAGNCPNTNPNDNASDSRALQWCLDNLNKVILDPGSPGYIVTSTLFLRRDNQTITSSRKPTQASIIAGRDLFAQILRTDGPRGGFVIEYISFNGRVHVLVGGKPWRRRRDQCTATDTGHPGNVGLEGHDFIVRKSQFVQALCGSGLGVVGDRYRIEDNIISRNGRDRFAPRPPNTAPWADGLTVLKCQDSFVQRNTLIDNTDIALVVGGGHRCTIQNNTIRQSKRFAFVGLNIGKFIYNDHEFEGDHLGSVFRNNLIEAMVPNRLGMGILVGSHPFDQTVDVTHSGKMVRNTVRGATINLIVEGAEAGEVTGNAASGHQGTEQYGNCALSYDYTANTEEGSAVLLQPDPVPLEFHNQVCTPL